MTEKSPLRIGFAMCGSYCTYDKAIAALEKLHEKYPDVQPIMSERARNTDTRFGAADDFAARVEAICGKKIIATIPDAEPIGPKKLFDILVIAPCTGNTLAKIAAAVTDSAVTMACKAHMRNGRPVLIAVSTNDALSGSAKAIGELLARKNVFFVPFYQDDPFGKPTSLAADYGRLEDALEAALRFEQLQPVISAEAT